MAREFTFAVDVAWDGGRRTTASVQGKQPLDIATPPEFRGTDPDVWSPEDAFVAATASCLAVTVAALAEKEQVPLLDLDVHAIGIVGRRDDGRFGFVRIEQTVQAATDEASVERVRDLVERAEEQCLVSVSLALPVQLSIRVRAAATLAP
ncbi:MAG: OsmC family protein [Motilibacteraceae bacterium]